MASPGCRAHRGGGQRPARSTSGQHVLVPPYTVCALRPLEACRASSSFLGKSVNEDSLTWVCTLLRNRGTWTRGQDQRTGDSRRTHGDGCSRHSHRLPRRSRRRTRYSDPGKPSWTSVAQRVLRASACVPWHPRFRVHPKHACSVWGEFGQRNVEVAQSGGIDLPTGLDQLPDRLGHPPICDVHPATTRPSCSQNAMNSLACHVAADNEVVWASGRCAGVFHAEVVLVGEEVCSR